MIKFVTPVLMVLMVASTPVLAKKTSTLVYDETNSSIVGKNINTTRPIASLTKIMTAVVALEHDRNLKRIIAVPAGSKIPARKISRGQVLAAMMVRSDNAASEALAADYPGGRRAFIRQMNLRAKQLQMNSTRFTDPSGLNASNVSTVSEIHMLISVALTFPEIANISVLPEVEFKKQKYRVILQNTNRNLLADFDGAIFSKTGYTRSAGWNVAMVLEHRGRRFTVIVIGAATPAARYELATQLIQRHLSVIDVDLANPPPGKFMSMWNSIVDFIMKIERQDLP